MNALRSFMNEQTQPFHSPVPHPSLILFYFFISFSPCKINCLSAIKQGVKSKACFFFKERKVHCSLEIYPRSFPNAILFSLLSPSPLLPSPSRYPGKRHIPRCACWPDFIPSVQNPQKTIPGIKPWCVWIKTVWKARG